MKIGDKVLVLQPEDEYRGREGVIIEISRSLVQLRFKDGTEGNYDGMDGYDIQSRKEK